MLNQASANQVSGIRYQDDFLIPDCLIRDSWDGH